LLLRDSLLFPLLRAAPVVATPRFAAALLPDPLLKLAGG
jgi:hypothetical protein